MTILLDIIFTFTQRVPELDGPVARTRHNLPVISAETDRKDVGGVANKATCCGTGVEVPEAKSVIPGRRQSELAVRGNDNIGNEMIMPVEDALGVTVGVVVASQLPDDDGLVCGREIRY